MTVRCIAIELPGTALIGGIDVVCAAVRCAGAKLTWCLVTTWPLGDDDRVLHFVDDDPGYLGWIADHPAGYVVNTTRNPSAAYLMLHHATCWTITRLQPRATTFTGEWSKLCGGRSELEAHARSLGRAARTCGHCPRSP